MAIAFWGQFPQAQEARLLAQLKNTSASGNDQPVQNTIDVAINTAINSGLFSTTASMSGIAAQDVQNMMGILNGLGYVISYAGTTLTISWNV